MNFTILWPCIVTDSFWIKPTGALTSNFIGITTLHVSDSLSAHHQEFLAVHRRWYILCSCLQFHPTPGSKRSQLHKMCQSRCTDKNSWWWTERLPETCGIVIPIKLEVSASVGFIHKDFEWSFNTDLYTAFRFSRPYRLRHPSTPKLRWFSARCMNFSYLIRYLMSDMGLLGEIKSDYQYTVEMHT